MKKLGCKLEAKEIYDSSQRSLKDAIVSLGGGSCTGGFISSQGMLFTNHHCGYDAIATHSSKENDLLKNGFWARKLSEELPNEGLTASVLVYMTDVTKVIEENSQEIENEEIRSIKIAIVIDSIERYASEGGRYQAEVKPFFKGNEYYLVVSEVFKDVRLVGAPPAGIGKFGGEGDNWMYPRHTGDFCIFRVYSDQEGRPAAYSPTNIPYRPRKFLKISMQGYKPGDFSFILGYPGQTKRYLSSYDLTTSRDVTNPALIEALGQSLDIYREEMKQDRRLALRLASGFASTSNGYKAYQGQERQLYATSFPEERRKEEEAFSSWINSSPERRKKYGSLLSDISQLNDKIRHVEPLPTYMVFGIFEGRLASYWLDLLPFTTRFSDEELKEAPYRKDSLRVALAGKVKTYFQDSALALDKRVLTEEVLLLYRHMQEADKKHFLQLVFLLRDTGWSTTATIREELDRIYKHSFLLNGHSMEYFLSSPSVRRLTKDPFYILMSKMYEFYRRHSAPVYTANEELDRKRKYFLAAWREWKNEQLFYPDANSTLRLTYGTVQAYYPKNAVYYNYYTTHQGLIEKHFPDEPEYTVPERQLVLLKQKKFGKYAVNDSLRLNFLTNTDITGGNSGSPVLDSRGRVIGIAFDGNWESMLSDLRFDPAHNRTISVDIRYVLWVMDIYAGADNLLRELDIEK